MCTTFNNLPSISFRDENLNDYPNVVCNDVDLEQFRQLKLHSHSFSLLNVNIRSCRRNFPSLEAFLSIQNSNFSIISLTETWLEESHDHAFNLYGYKKYSLYRNRYGGGVSIYVRSSLNSKIISELSYVSDDIEILTLSVAASDTNYIVSCIYRPPSSPIDIFNMALANNVLPFVNSKKCIMCGDFNINLYNPTNSNHVNNFISTMGGHDFYPIIDKPTRLSPNNPITKFSLLDQIWYNIKPEGSIDSAVVHIEISDHLPVLSIFNHLNTSDGISYEMRKTENVHNVNRFIELVRQVNFYDCDCNNINHFASYFTNQMYKAFNLAFPLIRVHINSGYNLSLIHI